MLYIFLLILCFVIGVAYLYRLRQKDKVYLEASAKASLGKDLKKEIESEKQDFIRRKQKFGDSVTKASRKQNKISSIVQ